MKLAHNLEDQMQYISIHVPLIHRDAVPPSSSHSIHQLASRHRACLSRGLRAAQQGLATVVDECVGGVWRVIQPVHHPVTDPATSIPTWEAEQTQNELWASSVETRNADPAPQAELLLLTFARQTQDVEHALLESPLASRAAWPVQQIWRLYQKGRFIVEI